MVPYPVLLQELRQQRRGAGDGYALDVLVTSKTDCSELSYLRKKSQPSLSSRFKGKAGYVVPRTILCGELRGICDRHGILLIADEVHSGMGQNDGKWWEIEHTGVQPDIVLVVPKGIASGMPSGVCMARAEIMDWVPGSHASTFEEIPSRLQLHLRRWMCWGREQLRMLPLSAQR